MSVVVIHIFEPIQVTVEDPCLFFSFHHMFAAELRHIIAVIKSRQSITICHIIGNLHIVTQLLQSILQGRCQHADLILTARLDLGIPIAACHLFGSLCQTTQRLCDAVHHMYARDRRDQKHDKEDHQTLHGKAIARNINLRCRCT